VTKIGGVKKIMKLNSVAATLEFIEQLEATSRCNRALIATIDCSGGEKQAAQGGAADALPRTIRIPFFSNLFQGSVYLPQCREALRILQRRRRPKATPRETTFSFSF